MIYVLSWYTFSTPCFCSRSLGTVMALAEQTQHTFVMQVPSFAEFTHGKRVSRIDDATNSYPSDQSVFAFCTIVEDRSAGNAGWPTFYCASHDEARIAALSTFSSFSIVRVPMEVPAGTLDGTSSLADDSEEVWLDGIPYTRDGAICEEHLEWERSLIQSDLPSQ